jgi:hypothetical protein
VLPHQRVVGIPLHQDIPVPSLTRLSTKPTNRYRYLQIRQRTLHAVTPVHTYAEFTKFKQHVLDAQFSRHTRQQRPVPIQDAKQINFEKFAIFWNSEVEKQSRTETDTNKRIYYKLPSQLERHYKKTLAWKSERSTILMGGNAAALKPFHDLLSAENTTITPAPQLPPELYIGERDYSYDEEGELMYYSLNA